MSERRRRSRSNSRSRERPRTARTGERENKNPKDAKERPRSKSRSPAPRRELAMASVAIEKENVPGDRKDQIKVDREKTCPLLLRVFTCQGRHHRPDEFTRNSYPPDELQVYTWMDATLGELMTLIKEVKADARSRFTTFSYATVFPDTRRGGFRVKEIGTTCAGRKSAEDSVTLGNVGFQIGDFIDVAIDPRRGPFRRY